MLRLDAHEVPRYYRIDLYTGDNIYDAIHTDRFSTQVIAILESEVPAFKERMTKIASEEGLVFNMYPA